MIITIYLPFLGLKDIDVAKALMEIKAEHPEKPIIGVFMTKNEFFTKLQRLQLIYGNNHRKREDYEH